MNISEYRPSSFDDYIGQQRVKDLLLINIETAIKTKTHIGHILFYGSAGLGKTTLAKIVSIHSKRSFTYISGPSISKPLDLISVLGNLKKNDILFIDEIHRIPKYIEEILYNAVEDNKLRFFYENNENSKAIEIDLPEFTLIGATTLLSLVSQPLRTRFQMILKIEDYTQVEIIEILRKLVKKIKICTTEEALSAIARASRSTPRIARNIFENSINVCSTYTKNILNKDAVLKTLKMLQINPDGLTFVDLKILEALKNRYDCKATSLEAISSVINEDVNDILIINEPFLVKSNYINRTKRGRIITEKGIKALM